MLGTSLSVMGQVLPALASQSTKVVAIPLENQTYDDIIGSSQAPYINNLFTQGTVFTKYSAVADGSHPNYLAMTSGLTTKGLMESMTGTCGGGTTGNVPGSTDPLYSADHDPAYAYRGNTTCTTNDVPLTASGLSAANLANFTYLVPNECDDMHTAMPSDQSCPAFFGPNSGTSQITVGDNWLSQVVPMLLAQPNVTVLITWDEYNFATGQNGPWEHIVTLEVGAGVTAGGIDGNAYNHYGL